MSTPTLDQLVACKHDVCPRYADRVSQVGEYRQSTVDILNAGPPPEWGPGPHYGWALGVVKASLPPATQQALQRFLDAAATPQ